MIGEIRPFDTIGIDERQAATDAIAFQLSGYLAGKERGGREVCALEDAWADTFKVKHAIAVNSATSGLLAASFAVGLKAGDEFICPAMTMSATCAAPMFTGAMPVFCDVGPDRFCMMEALFSKTTKALFITNLFGHPAELHYLRGQCDRNNVYMIEDNAQSPFATENSHYAGTIGHIGIFSLNYHKHIQTGEGGVCTTNDDDLAARLRMFINHAEVYDVR